MAKKPEDDDDEWGLDLDSKPTLSGLGGRSSLLGRKPKKDDVDDLDNVLDVLEAKRGLESSKQADEPPPQQRPKTAAVKKSQWDAPAELDDLEEGASKATDSQMGGNDHAMAAKRRTLFGLGSSGGAADPPQQRASTAPRSRTQNQARPATGLLSDAND